MRRFSSGPPERSSIAGGSCISPILSGSTLTVVPSGPPDRGSVSGFGSTLTFIAARA